MMFAGKLAMVTGGGSGIGRAVCRVLAREGARVVAADLNPDAAQQTVDMLINPNNHLAVSMNVVEKASIASAIRTSVEKYSTPPSLVANAAGITRDNFLLQMEENTFMEVLDVNVKGSFLVTQLVAGQLVEHGLKDGAIVNLSSIIGKTGNLGQCNYAASKAAVNGFTKTAARELAKLGIRVNSVLPGFTRTPMTETVPDKVIEKLLKLIPLHRVAEPEEIAEVVAFLLSDKSSYMTGTCVEVTGGLAM
ncbi:putative estradiol 17-beta-dehydrogenase 8 [Penaeus vannamei]|uniref:(3R)-3-hydroxyacyl-CoA dehydrogenase n=1 Tax=Penaeus vannamei TaxID=6689 RepID=A0A423TQI6_PENVA|nr:putative estradiol 17-beta-dehydrogenase 8 [Penaeus vannamei]